MAGEECAGIVLHPLMYGRLIYYGDGRGTTGRRILRWQQLPIRRVRCPGLKSQRQALRRGISEAWLLYSSSLRVQIDTDLTMTGRHQWSCQRLDVKRIQFDLRGR